MNSYTEYPGAEVVEKNDQWWIVHDRGETGPFDSYDEAAAEADAGWE